MRRIRLLSWEKQTIRSLHLRYAKDRLSMSGADGLGDGGYVLNVDPGDSAGGTIVIEGKDGDGTFYGVQTLRQLAEVRDGKTVIASAEITDEPRCLFGERSRAFTGIRGAMRTGSARLNFTAI